MTRQTRARWIFIFGVLAGLFFSGGEGIQLFPFPSAESRTSKISASVFDENSKSYAFSVFSSRSYFALLKSKLQKDVNQYLSGRHLTFARTETGVNPGLQTARNRQETDLLRLPRVSGSRSKRAPPAV